MSHPIPLTLLICDHAWRDPNSGKYSLLGIFSGYASSTFPFEIDRTAYFAVTDGQGMLPSGVAEPLEGDSWVDRNLLKAENCSSSDRFSVSWATT